MAIAIPLIVGGLGAWAGSAIGIAGGAAIGWAIGSEVGSIIEQSMVGPQVPPNALTDLQVQTSGWGVGLPKVYGTQRLAGNIIWATDKQLVGGDQGKWGSKGGGGKGGAGKGKKGTGTQGYYVTGIAFALCEGNIGGIKRIWAGGDLIFDDGQPVYVPSMDPSEPQGGYQTFTANNQPIISTGGSSLGTWTLYHGTNLQEPDPTIVANGSGNGMEGVPYQKVTLQNGFEYSYGSPQYGKMGTACAYRGIAYIVFSALNCGYGGSIPPLTFEVVGQPGTLDAPAPLQTIQGVNNMSGAAVIDDGVIFASSFWSSSHPAISLQNTETGQPYYATWIYNGMVSLVAAGAAIIGNNPSDGWYEMPASGGSWTKLTDTGTPDTGISNNHGAFVLNEVVYAIGQYNATPATWSFCTPQFGSGTVNPSDGYQYANSLTLPTGAVPSHGWGVYGGNGFPRTDVVADNGFSLPVIANVAYWFSGATLWSFDGDAFGSVATGLPSEPNLVCSDGASLWAAIATSGQSPFTYNVYKVALDGMTTEQFAISTGPSSSALAQIVWANGWFYGANGETLYKFNADGSTRYKSAIPGINLACNIVVISKGLFVIGDSSATIMSFGDTGLTPVPPELPEVLQELCDRAGFSAYDTSLVPSLPVNFTRRAGTATRDILKMLGQLYQFDMVDSAGVLRFVPKGQNIVGQLSYDDIGYAKPGQNGTTPASPYMWERLQGTYMPRSVLVKYTSALANYNTTSQFYQIHDPYGRDVVLNFPVTLDDRTALTAAMLLCVEPHIERMAYSWSTSFNKLQYEPGDVLQMPWGVTRITQVQLRGGLAAPTLDFQGVIDASYVIFTGQGNAASVNVPQQGQPTYYAPALSAANSGALIASALQPLSAIGQIPTKAPIYPGTAYAALIEVPPLTSRDTSPYYLIAPWTTGKAFIGAALFESTDGGETYSEIAEQANSGVVGWASTVLPATQPWTWDTTSTVNIYLNGTYMQLSGATDLQVIQGANLALLGNELIQFANATLSTDANGKPYYALSRLLRGRRGTESQMATHSAGDTFVLIQSGDDTAVDYGLHDINNDAEFKVATVGQNISGINAQDFAPTGLWYKPFAPADVQATADASKDWNVSFVPRARLNGWWGSGVAPSLDADTQTWSADILNGTTVKRTLSGSLTSPSFQYTAAEQSADGFTPGAHGIGINVYEVGQLGRGYAASITT